MGEQTIKINKPISYLHMACLRVNTKEKNRAEKEAKESWNGWGGVHTFLNDLARLSVSEKVTPSKGLGEEEVREIGGESHKLCGRPGPQNLRLQLYAGKGFFADLLENGFLLFGYQVCCMLPRQCWELIQEVNRVEIWRRMFQEERISRTMAVEQRSRLVYGAGRSPSSGSGRRRGREW